MTLEATTVAASAASSVLIWVVAVECHSAPPGRRSELDFKAPVSRRALEWAEALRDRPGVQMLMNVSAVPASPEMARLDALRPRLLNPDEAHRADANALHISLAALARDQPFDQLLLLWIGHGVMNNRQRYLLHQGTTSADNLRSWELDSLLQHLRSANAPPLQIGLFDTCAQVWSERPGNEQLGGSGNAVRAQHFYFASTAAAIASANPFEPTLASETLAAIQAIDWPPQPRALDALLQPKIDGLPSRPVRFEWTQGSGDQWSSRHASGADNAEIARQALRSRTSELLFRHVWQEAASAGVTAGDLAKAIRADKVEALAKKLARARPDASEPDLLRDAWQRAKTVELWAADLADLGLSLPQWSDLAQQLVNQDARHAGAFAELRELLLWSLDMNRDALRDKARAHRALLALMVLAIKLAERSGLTGASRSAAEAAARLDAAFRVDPTMAPLLASVQRSAVLTSESVVLYVEIELAANAVEPSVQRHWLMRDDIIEPGAELALEGPMGEQLKTLIDRVQRGEARPIRVELLAPFVLLCGQGEWLSYSIDLGELTGVAGSAGQALARVGLDKFWPICWRWKDRLQGKRLDLLPAFWQQRAAAVQQRARGSAQLHCRFDDDAAAPGEDAHVRGLLYLPPSPAQARRNAEKFYRAMIGGDPYMLWPGADPADGEVFKTTVRDWLAGQRLSQLPEALCRARSANQLPELVLFLDEPDRNPYAQTQHFQTLAEP